MRVYVSQCCLCVGVHVRLGIHMCLSNTSQLNDTIECKSLGIVLNDTNLCLQPAAARCDEVQADCELTSMVRLVARHGGVAAAVLLQLLLHIVEDSGVKVHLPLDLHVL